MVHYDFLVDIFEADAIHSIMREAILRHDEIILDYMTKENTQEYIKWHREYKEYLIRILEKMKYSVVESDGDSHE